MDTRRPLSKIIAVIITFTFFITQVGWAADEQYIPFNENQDQNQYLVPEQLQRFSSIKTTLIEQHNATSGTALQTEEEIINYLYNLINPEDFTTLKQLESDYNSSVTEKNAAWDAFVSQKSLLEDYYKQIDYLTASLDSIYLQISSVKQKINDVEQDKLETEEKIQNLEGRIALKNTSVQNKLQEASSLEATIDDLKSALSQLNDDKVVRKKDVDDAEALLNEKTAQKTAFENELSTILNDLNTKWEEVEAETDPIERAVKEAEYNALQDLYDATQASYDAFLVEYNAAQTSYDLALSAYENKLSAIEATQNSITQNETDLLSDYETIKLFEHDIDALTEEQSTQTSHYNYLNSAIGTLNGSLNTLDNKRIELEEFYGVALNAIEQQLEETGSNDKLQEFKAAVANERSARSLYEKALEARSRLASSLRNQDKNLQSLILSVILDAPVVVQEDGIQYESEGQTIVLTEEEINNLLLASEEALLLVDGKSISESRNNIEALRKSLRENYSKIFGKEPTEQMLSGFIDIITRAKMPAIRLFEILKRINDKNLKATEDEKLEVEDSAINPGSADQGLIQDIVSRLQDESVSSDLIKGAISYLTTLPFSLVSCGVIALGGLFDMIGKTASREKIAEEAVLTDILAGFINKDTTGELKLSLYALKKAAEANGETLYGRKLTGDDFVRTSTPFIAHVDDDHYVLVKKIEGQLVNFFDPATQNDETSTVQDFMQRFTGYALTQKNVEEGTLLEDGEMKTVFGAGWWSSAKKAVKKAVKTVTKTVKKVAKTVTKTVTKVAKTVTKTVKKVVSAVASTAKKVASAVASTAKKVASAVTSTAKKVASAVASTAKKVADKVAEKVNEIKEKAETTYNDAKETVNEAQEKGAELLDKAKEKAEEVWEKAKEEYNSRKEANDTGKQNAQQDKSFIDSLIDFFTIIPGVSAASPGEGDFSGDPFADENSLAANNLSQGNNSSSLWSKIVSFFGLGENKTARNEQNTLTNNIEDAQMCSIDPALVNAENTADTATEEAAYDAYDNTGQEQMCVAEDTSDLRIDGLGLGLYGGIRNLYPVGSIARETIENLDTVEGLFMSGNKFFINGMKLDFGGGQISPHDASDLISVSRTANPALGGQGISIWTKDFIDTGELQVLEELNKQGFKTSTIYYENVPAPRSQRSQAFKLFDEILDEGGEVHITPRPQGVPDPSDFKEGTKEWLNAMDDYERGSRQIADDLADEIDGIVKPRGYKTSTSKIPGFSYSKGHQYTVKKSITWKGATFTILKWGGYIALAYEAVTDAISLHDANEEDKAQSGGCKLEETAGRIGGKWVTAAAGVKLGGAVGAVVGGAIGGVIGAYFGVGAGAAPGVAAGAKIGGAIGALAGGLIGGWLGGEAGESVGEAACDIAGTGIQQNLSNESGIPPEYMTPPPFPRTPIHETVSYIPSSDEIFLEENVFAPINSEVSGGKGLVD